MPPWRTVEDTREGGKPVSLTTIESASSAAWRCCTSKSGGTYSASITGVSGSTLTNRIAPSDGPAIIRAVNRGLGKLLIGEVDRNENLRVHGAVPPSLVLHHIATPAADGEGEGSGAAVAPAAGSGQTRSAAASERGLTKRSSRPPRGCTLPQSLVAKS